VRALAVSFGFGFGLVSGEKKPTGTTKNDQLASQNGTVGLRAARAAQAATHGLETRDLTTTTTTTTHRETDHPPVCTRTPYHTLRCRAVHTGSDTIANNIVE